MDCFAELFYGSFGMATLIQKVARLAHQTFQQLTAGPGPRIDSRQFADGLHKLKCLSGQVRKTDVGLTPELLGLGLQDQGQEAWTEASREAPVSYIEIFENEVFTLGIFVLKNGARIPLHDHPDMYGIVKVLHGRLRIQSYSRVLATPPTDPRGDAFAVTKFPARELGEEDEPCCLTPEDANYHEIRALGGVAAFLDILAPPYDHRVRECRFYREVAELDSDPSSRGDAAESAQLAVGTGTFLAEIPSPADYWSNSKPYDGPEVDF